MIESFQNDKIKKIVRLSSDNRFRKRENVFLVEGIQENQRALEFDYRALEFFICQDFFKQENYYLSLKKSRAKIYEVSPKVYKKIAYREDSGGIIGIYETKNHHISNFVPKENSSLIVMEGVEKPGNLGAVLRSVEAFGIDAVVVTDPKLDIYNPNVIRSSVGCLFGTNIYVSDNESLDFFLKENQFSIFTTFMGENFLHLHRVDLSGKTALIFGTEHSGISSFWQNKGENILIPMVGSIDSLNLSNAVAISCYEFLRQKMEK